MWPGPLDRRNTSAAPAFGGPALDRFFIVDAPAEIGPEAAVARLRRDPIVESGS
jgi:hypothetical protein